MALATLLEYQALAVPAELDSTLLQDIAAVEASIKQSVGQALGEPILLSPKTG